jgi:hypothetical protein
VRAGILGVLALGGHRLVRHAPREQVQVQVLASNFRIGDPREFFEPIIQEAAVTHKIRPDLVRAVIEVESGFDPTAVSRVGALGLMQLMPDTARLLGVDDPLDPEQNIFGGAKYLGMLIDRFDGNVALAVASYNAGPTAVARYRGRIPPYRETRGYVKKVRAAQDDWLRESGEDALEPFELHPALFKVEKTKRARTSRKKNARKAIAAKSKRA